MTLTSAHFSAQPPGLPTSTQNPGQGSNDKTLFSCIFVSHLMIHIDKDIAVFLLQKVYIKRKDYDSTFCFSFKFHSAFPI